MKGHQFMLRLPEHPAMVDADPTRLAQIVANLVNNAAKYTPASGRIELTAETLADQLVVRVTDTGMGIPRDKLANVFEMFSQLDRSQGGLGIGLTLVRRLVEMHTGTVEVASEGEGRGSTFTVRLPLALSPVESVPHGAQASQVEGRSLRVLVVDDNADAAECLSLLLELRGHRTRMAYSGREALTAAAQFHPDVIFLDIGLPELDGYQVAEQLRADPAYRKTVLVALTGWGGSGDRRRAQEAGFDQHLVKPLDTSKLETILAGVQRDRSNT
jgi:CheY-like chemotaxis protein/anti-sigma regulatory factor (Ser/Thr protein kinase)